MMHSRPFTTLLYKRARIEEDNGGGKFLIPNDDEIEVPVGPGKILALTRTRK